MLSALQLKLLAVFEPDSTFWLPAARSEYAKNNDWVWDVVTYVSIFFFFVVIGSMTYFIIKYRRRGPNDKVSTVTHNTPIELIWTIIPLVLVMWFFKVGFTGFIDYSTPPSDAMVIQAEASQWNFRFVYANGADSNNVLYVPVNRPVRISMTSMDVTHALYIPNFHISKNMIRGRTTDLWFTAIKESGEAGYPLYCTQYCGKDHSRMSGKVVVLSEADYQKKLAELDNVFGQKDPKTGELLTYAAIGQKIYEASCRNCHSINAAEKNTGPTWDGLWVRDHEFTNAPTLSGKASDEQKVAYIAESLVRPEAKIVKGFGNNMTNFASAYSDNANADPDKDLQDYKKHEKVKAIAEYMKTLSDGKKYSDGSTYTYDPKKAPVFKLPKGESASAPGSESSAVTAPANK
jgi:cytochrome c oxidase subunit 2